MEAALIALSAALIAVLCASAALSASYVRSLHEDRNFQRARVVDLERQLAAHTWQEYAQLTALTSPLQQATAATNGWGEQRPEEAYGESAEDNFAHQLAGLGLDLEGPTVG